MAARLASIAARLGTSSSYHATNYAVFTAGAVAVASAGAGVAYIGSTDSVTSCEAKRPPKSTLQTRMTSVGRWSLMSETPSNMSMPVTVLAMAGAPLTPADFTRIYNERGIEASHPRFAAKLNEDETHFVHGPKKNGLNSASTSATILENVTETIFPTVYRRELMGRLEDAITLPMNLQKYLWEAKICTGGRVGESGVISRSVAKEIIEQEGEDAVESLLMFRAHHCLADGVSLGTIFSDMMDEAPEFQAIIKEKIQEMKERAKKMKNKLSAWERLLRLIYFWYWGTIRAIVYQMNLYWSRLITQSPWDILREEFESKPHTPSARLRHLSWVQMSTTDQLREVAAYYSKATSSGGKRRKVTINDVIASCVSAAVAKQLAYHRATKASSIAAKSKPLPDLKYMNLVVPVHMQGGVLLPGQSLGNKIGALVCKVPAKMKGDDGESVTSKRLVARTTLFKVPVISGL